MAATRDGVIILQFSEDHARLDKARRHSCSELVRTRLIGALRLGRVS